MLSDKNSYFGEGQILLFDKPLYWTSFDLVKKVRVIIKNNLNLRNIKVGHAGTLDPLARGLMILCTGKATKRIADFREMDKEYTAVFQLGMTTPSFDLETETDETYPADHITLEMLERTLTGFLGKQKQIPPVHSAKMIEGRRSYEYARKGISKEPEPVTVWFREIELISFSMPEVKIRLLCSKGTYIRSFARDLGKALNSGACLTALVRNSIGPYKLENAFSPEKFEKFVREMKQTGNFFV